jgi:flagellar protein FliS
MSLSNPYAQYRQTSVETATPTRLIVMLYDGAIRFLSQALPAMHAKKYDQQSLLIGKAQSIIAYLRDTLDHETGRTFAGSLDTIYAALQSSLNEACIYDKPEHVEKAIEVLRDLREAWAEVDRQCQAGKAERISERTLVAA